MTRGEEEGRTVKPGRERLTHAHAETVHAVTTANPTFEHIMVINGYVK